MYSYPFKRRWVVSTDAHSPIKTYNFKGTKKTGIGRDQHGMIFTGRDEPPLEENEPRLRKKAIQMIPVNLTVKLDPTSRINYGKPTPVEHNLRVEYIGDIYRADLYRLYRYFDLENSTQDLKDLAEDMRDQAEAFAADERAPRTKSKSRSFHDRKSRSRPPQYSDENVEDTVFEEEGDDRYDVKSGRLPSESGRRHSVHTRRPSTGQSLVESPTSIAESRVARGQPIHRAEPHARRDSSNTAFTSVSSPVPSGSLPIVSSSQRRMTLDEYDQQTRRSGRETHKHGDRKRRY